MSSLNSKKAAPLHAGYEWAGTIARFQRGAKSTRAGRRAALLGVLSSVYANASRGATRGLSESRGHSDRS